MRDRRARCIIRLRNILRNIRTARPAASRLDSRAVAAYPLLEIHIMIRPLTLLALFGLLAAGPGVTNVASADDDYYDDLEDYYEDLAEAREDLAEAREEYYEENGRRFRGSGLRGYGYHAPPVYQAPIYQRNLYRGAYAPRYGYGRGYGYGQDRFSRHGYPSYGYGDRYYGGSRRGFNLNAGPFSLSIR